MHECTPSGSHAGLAWFIWQVSDFSAGFDVVLDHAPTCHQAIPANRAHNLANRATSGRVFELVVDPSFQVGAALANTYMTKFVFHFCCPVSFGQAVGRLCWCGGRRRGARERALEPTGTLEVLVWDS
jgi:hypothetical protein